MAIKEQTIVSITCDLHSKACPETQTRVFLRPVEVTREELAKIHADDMEEGADALDFFDKSSESIKVTDIVDAEGKTVGKTEWFLYEAEVCPAGIKPLLTLSNNMEDKVSRLVVPAMRATQGKLPGTGKKAPAYDRSEVMEFATKRRMKLVQQGAKASEIEKWNVGEKGRIAQHILDAFNEEN